MNVGLLGAIAGLAVLDAFNPATIVAVTLILIAAPHRPGLTALSTVLGAALTVFTAGAVLFLAAGAAAGAVDGIVIGLASSLLAQLVSRSSSPGSVGCTHASGLGSGSPVGSPRGWHSPSAFCSRAPICRTRSRTSSPSNA